MKWFYLPGRRAKGLLPQEEKAEEAPKKEKRSVRIA